MRETKFYIYGKSNNCTTDIALMPTKWIRELAELEDKFGVEYNEETDAYYLARKKYFAFKRAVKKALGFSVEIYALRG